MTLRQKTLGNACTNASAAANHDVRSHVY